MNTSTLESDPTVPPKAAAPLSRATSGLSVSAIVPLLTRLIDWRTMAALVDQALVSGTRFVTTIVIGRLCGPAELGLYCLAFAPLVLAGCLLEALIATPYTILGARFSKKRREQYAGSTLVHLAGLATVAMAIVAGIAVGILLLGGSSVLATSLLVVAAVIPFSLLWEFARRHAFAHLRMPTALAVDASVAAIQLTGLAALAWTRRLSTATGFALIGLACAVTGTLWLVTSWKQLRFKRAKVRAAWKRNWSFGKWIAASQLTGAVHGNVVPWFLAALASTYATGMFAASQSLVLLSNPVIMAVSNILGPRVAQARVSGGHTAVGPVTWKAARLLLLVTTCFCGFLILFRQQLITLLFGAEFAEDTSVLVVMSFASLAWGLSAAVGIGLTALERPDINTKANVVGLIITALSALLVSHTFGALGGAIALLLGSLALVVIQTVAFITLSKVDLK